MEQYKKIAQKNTVTASSTVPDAVLREDNLYKVIRTQKDADTFMIELNNVIRQAQAQR
ncbi:hypothetical protein LX64_00697 [Chitinophaga skermanii]|uniref:Uncharacterized protein n=2 Tax=Chitinophaga skermanii TaxID=331697 RepID=A0A327R2M2_9BACT|nr:hypothetical protein LX64_00697 [Chitinophaga skermanii]